MALPSQSDRGTESGGRGVMGPGNQGPSNQAKIAIIIAGLVIAAGGIFALTRLSGAKKDGHEGASRIDNPLVKNETPAPITIQRNDLPVAPGIDAQSSPAKGLPDVTGSSTSVGTSVPVVPPTNDSTIHPPPPQSTPLPTTVAPLVPRNVLDAISAGDSAYNSNKLVDARAHFSKALLNPDATREQKDSLRAKVAAINEDLIFSTRIDPADPLVESYKVQSGDALERLPRRRELATDWRLIQRINRIARPESIRVGQTLKLVRGPFHAVVNKSEYRVDVYAGSPDEPANWLYIRSYRCGLGEGNSTPVGNYVVKKASKLVNPPWVNPRTGERFGADDPNNPIGEFWIGWQGVGQSASNQGYGFHGTIDPSSIGQQKSMGCVRLGPDDIAQLYELLVEEVSVVRVLP